MKISENTAVQIHYNLTVDGGIKVDSTAGCTPLAYLHGHGRIVAGVERALEGKAAGDRLKIVVSPKDGYGERDPKLDILLPKTVFSEAFQKTVVEGARFRAPHPDNSDQMTTYLVVKIDDAEILATANHPLAGQTLNFDVEVVDVRPGTPSEIADGVVQRGDCSPGCC